MKKEMKLKIKNQIKQNGMISIVESSNEGSLSINKDNEKGNLSIE